MMKRTDGERKEGGDGWVDDELAHGFAFDDAVVDEAVRLGLRRDAEAFARGEGREECGFWVGFGGREDDGGLCEERFEGRDDGGVVYAFWTEGGAQGAVEGVEMVAARTRDDGIFVVDADENAVHFNTSVLVAAAETERARVGCVGGAVGVDDNLAEFLKKRGKQDTVPCGDEIRGAGCVGMQTRFCSGYIW